jgi:putative transcriptional regulator
MAMRKKKSEILEAVHDTAKGLYRSGVMDVGTLREFARLCVPPIELLLPEKLTQFRKD